MTDIALPDAFHPQLLPGSWLHRLAAADVPRLQAFFDANPAYFQAVAGRPAQPDEAQAVVDERPPAGVPWRGRWLLGWTDAGAAAEPPGDAPLWAMAELVGDLFAPGVWHIALLIVATGRHGRGDAQRLMAALVPAIQASGARWLRLGVVQGHRRAERFWLRQGFTALRQRQADVSGRLQTVRVMLRPLGAEAARPDWVADYLAAVPRDRPEPG